MDTNGARHLQARIAQHQHWLLADAVRAGEQPATDPDADRLEEMGDGYRLYAPEQTAGADGVTLRRLRKTLVDGRWEAALVDATES
jgi:hypothetical protein